MLVRHKKTKKASVPSYYSGLSVFSSYKLAERRIRTLKRSMFNTHEFRILPWHTEMGEVDLREMWRSALGENDG